LLVAGMVCLLALLNTAVSAWTGVIDARQPLAVARALGATPAQAALGLAAAQLLPAIPGVGAGIWLGVGLFAGGDNRFAPASWMWALAAGVLLGVAALTAVPALTAARHPVADTLHGSAS
jgi:putative ABC transport system permease protein